MSEIWKQWRHSAEPYKPSEGYDESVVYAFRAMAAGEANDGQQQLVWRYIQFVAGVGEFEDLSFRPGAGDGERMTAFAEGKRFVGLQLLKMLHPATLETVIVERQKSAEREAERNRRESMRGRR